MDDRPYDILVMGELNVDLVLTGDVVPEFGQVEKLVDDLAVCAGASSAIFAASAAKMGLSVLYISVVGDDLFGHFMVQSLKDAGVDTSMVRIDPGIRTGATVILSRGQDRAMLTYLGSIAAITEDDIPPASYALARHLHVASPFLITGLRPAMPRMMRRAKREGLTVSLDTNWDPTERWQLGGFFENVDVFLPNENELLAITGQTDEEKAINEMAGRVPVLAVKKGSRGALAAQGACRVEIPAYCVEVKDTTGAGDSFDGGFLAGWLRGEPLRRCLSLGAACGALAVRQVGGFGGQPTWDQAETFILAAEQERGA